MKIQFIFQGTSGSPWMNEYMKGRLERLEKYVPQSAQIDVELVTGDIQHRTRLSIRSLKQHHVFNGAGADLYESFTIVLEEALKTLRREHQRIVSRKFTRLETSL